MQVNEREAVFPGVWDALRANRACALALLEVCASFHTLIMARPVEEWQGRHWQQLWTATAGSAMRLTAAAVDDTSLDLVQSPLQRELLAVRARLEGLHRVAPTPVLLACQATCCSYLIFSAQNHLDAWRVHTRAGQVEPYLPHEFLESLAAGASGLIPVLALNAGPGGPHAPVRGWQVSGPAPTLTLVAALQQLSKCCEEVLGAAGEGEEQEEEHPCLIGPGPLAAAKATEACLRLAAVLPEWLAGVGGEAQAALAEDSPHAPRLLVVTAELLASGTGNAIVLEGQVPSAVLSAAAYNSAVSAAKVCLLLAGKLDARMCRPAWLCMDAPQAWLRVPARQLLPPVSGHSPPLTGAAPLARFAGRLASRGAAAEGAGVDIGRHARADKRVSPCPNRLQGRAVLQVSGPCSVREKGPLPCSARPITSHRHAHVIHASMEAQECMRPALHSTRSHSSQSALPAPTCMQGHAGTHRTREQCGSAPGTATPCAGCDPSRAGGQAVPLAAAVQRRAHRLRCAAGVYGGGRWSSGTHAGEPLEESYAGCGLIRRTLFWMWVDRKQCMYGADSKHLCMRLGKMAPACCTLPAGARGRRWDR